MTPELNGVARAFLETVERVRHDFGADVAVVRTQSDTAAAELRAQVAALARKSPRCKRKPSRLPARSWISAPAKPKIERVRRTLGDDVAEAHADNEAAAGRIAALETANAALARATRRARARRRRMARIGVACTRGRLPGRRRRACLAPNGRHRVSRHPAGTRHRGHCRARRRAPSRHPAG